MEKLSNTFDSISKTKAEKTEPQNLESDLGLNNYTPYRTEIKTFKSNFNNYVSEIAKNLKDLFK